MKKLITDLNNFIIFMETMEPLTIGVVSTIACITLLLGILFVAGFFELGRGFY